MIRLVLFVELYARLQQIVSFRTAFLFQVYFVTNICFCWLEEKTTSITRSRMEANQKFSVFSGRILIRRVICF